MVKPDYNPDRATLKQFGFIALVGYLLFALIVALKSGFIVWSGGWFEFDFSLGEAGPIATGFIAFFLALAVICPIFSLVSPPLLRPVWVVMIFIGSIVGFVVGHVVLTLIYAFVFTPIGLIMRALGRDPMMRKFEPDAPTYWEKRPPVPESARYFRPF